MAMRHDEAFKFLFDVPEVCADTLRVAAPALWPHLDPDSVRNLRVGDTVAADLSRRGGDALFGVDLRGAALADGRPAYVVVPTEFQSGDDPNMPGRMREYAARQLDTLRRQGLIPAADAPAVLPLVVYDGFARWSAADGLEPLRPLPAEAAAYLGEPLNKSVHGLVQVASQKRGFGLLHRFNGLRHRIWRHIPVPR